MRQRLQRGPTGRRIGRIGAGIAIIALLASGASAETLVLEHFTLIDGTGRAAQRDQSLILVDGRVTEVGPAARIKAPKGATREDLTGKFLMPGIIDSHVHLGLVDGIEQSFPKYYDRVNVEQQLKLYAAYGVTSVYTLGTDGDEIHTIIADQRRVGRINGARAFTAGRGVVYKGSYGGVPGLDQQVSTPAETTAMVRREVAKGDDFVKLWMDDEFGDVAERMPYPISKAAIDTAHALGKKAVGHIFYDENAAGLVAQGVDGFMHQVRDKAIGPKLIADMKAKRTWQLASTLSREASFTYKLLPFVDDPFFARGVAPATIAALKSPERQARLAAGKHFGQYPAVLDMALKNFGTMAKAGIPYGMGTDSGPTARFPGYFAHWELELMVKSGVTPLQALTAATGTNAKFLNARDIGTVERGKWGDLLVLDRDPTTDIRNTRSIRAVYVAGIKQPTIWQTCTGRAADACGPAPR
ncbi:amidohydrolase family protein [uncultured Sphingomonas sp.]|uniref:amidohydrolase family protein n=1 Tax=uncultured Sphingomonas sp. TaxID=158754 RepID=UPI0025CD6C64|nr:amidohydrolase family protein [uncultured Sphingomonas sp.]